MSRHQNHHFCHLVLFNPLLLAKIVENVENDEASIYKLRSVCLFWFFIISKEMENKKRCWVKLDASDPAQDLERIEKLKDLMIKGNNYFPSWLFRRVEFAKCYLRNSSHENFTFFKQVSPYIKHLKLVEMRREFAATLVIQEEHTQPIYQVITVLVDNCPLLEELEIEDDNVHWTYFRNKKQSKLMEFDETLQLFKRGPIKRLHVFSRVKRAFTPTLLVHQIMSELCDRDVQTNLKIALSPLQINL